MRSVLLSSAFVLLFSLGCGGILRDADAVAAAVDAQPGPAGGPQLGLDAATVGPALDVSWAPAGETTHTGPFWVFHGTRMAVTATAQDGVVTVIHASASTPGSTGSESCTAVLEALTVDYGRPEGWGIPGVYPERYWAGRNGWVKWARTGELGTDRYHCEVTWRAGVMPR